MSSKKSEESLEIEREGREQLKLEREMLGDDFDHSMLMDIRKLSPFADVLGATSSISEVETIDSGVPILNAMISGSLYKGLPPTILGLSGASKSGKTYTLLKMVADAQRKGYTVVFFDTEGALDKEQAERHGINTNKIMYVRVRFVNEWGSILTTIIDNLMKVNTYKCPITSKTKLKAKSERKKYFIALDSLGNLTCTSDLNAIQKDSATMGTKAKEIRNVFRAITTPLDQLEVPLVFTNHIMENPGDTNPSKYDKNTGGMGPEYMATVLIQYRSSPLYENPNASGSARGEVIGTKLTARCTKNRIVPPLTEAIIELSFASGVNKYSGIIDKALEAGLFQMSGSWLVLSCGKKVYRTTLEKDEEEMKKALEPIMENLEKYINSSNVYSTELPDWFEKSE